MNRPAATPTVVSVRNLEARCRSGESIRGASFDLARGERLLVAGRAGAGQRALVRSLVGLEPATAGEVAVFGRDPRVERARVFQRTGWIASATRFEPRWSVGRVVEWTGRFHPRWDPAVAEKVLSEAGITLKQRADSLSPFHASVLALGLAFSMEPEFVVAEGASDLLDPGEKRRFFDLVGGLLAASPSITFVMAADSLAQAPFSNRLLFLQAGKPLVSGAVDDLEHSIRRITFTNEGEDARCLEEWFCHKVKIRGRELELIVDDFDETKWARFVETPGVEDPRVDPIPIDDLLRELSAERKAPGDASLEQRTRHVS